MSTASNIAACLTLSLCLTVGTSPVMAQDAAATAVVVRSAQSGPWSAAATWQGKQLPPANCKVLIERGHTVLYDVLSKTPIRSLHIDGTLRFAHDRDTLLETGLIRVQAGGTTNEEGFDCEAHLPAAPAGGRAALLVGTAEQPILPGRSAIIRLRYFEGMNKDSCPAVVCCGGRMELHGAPLNWTWLKLAAPAKAGDKEIVVSEPVAGWQLGDRILLTATTRQNKKKKTFLESTRDSTQSEERTLVKIDGAQLFLDQPLAYDHVAEGDYRGDVANLSRNVVIESADPETARGHTMFHRNSAGSISYAELRHLGKPGVLGRYSLHFHLCGDTMRGTSVIGASIWDSGNRWITIHGTNYLVVRDCVGYQSRGHGFFLEDGTEVNNVLDRNLAVQAYITKPLPNQVLPFDKNDGSGFWWANCHNAFTRNVAAECDEYGYFFQATKTDKFDPVLSVRRPDGTQSDVDIRTLPFIRFEDNEAHCQRRHAINIGGGVPFGPPNVGGIGPDVQHPLVLRNLRLWNVHWAIHPVSPSMWLENLDIHNAEYGVWRPEYRDHAYTGLKFSDVAANLHYAFVEGNRPPNQDAEFPLSLKPVDDLPPITIVTHVAVVGAGKLRVRGTTADNGVVKQVLVNEQQARAVSPNFAQWEVELDRGGSATIKLSARAIDEAGNQEVTAHELIVPGP